MKIEDVLRAVAASGVAAGVQVGEAIGADGEGDGPAEGGAVARLAAWLMVSLPVVAPIVAELVLERTEVAERDRLERVRRRFVEATTANLAIAMVRAGADVTDTKGHLRVREEALLMAEGLADDLEMGGDYGPASVDTEPASPSRPRPVS